MTITQSKLSGVLDEVTTAVAFDQSFYGESMVAALFSMRGMTGRREQIQSIGGLGRFTQKTETAAAAEDEAKQQFSKLFSPTPFAKTVVYSREAAEDEEWGFFQRLGISMGEAYQNTVEGHGADLFNDLSTGATYTAEDGLSIANNAHLNVDGGNSQDNLGSNALTMAGIKATRTAMRKTTNYEGDAKSRLKPNGLIIPVDKEEEGWEIVRSIGRPDTASRADNMYNGMFDLFVWDELTSTTAWSMVDIAKMKQNLLYLFKTPYEMYGDGDLFTGIRRMGGYFRSTLGCLDWRWLYYNTP